MHLHYALAFVMAGTSAVTLGHAGDSPGCLALTQLVPQGHALTHDVLLDAPCPPGASAVQRLHYDSDAHLVRAPRDLMAGDFVVSVPKSYLAHTRQGDALAVAYRHGSITITRYGTAMTDSAYGRSVVLRTSDGAVITAKAEQVVSP